MARTALPRAEGAILIDKKISIAVLMTIGAAIAGAGIAYANGLARLQTLETARSQMEPKLAEINERTIRMEENLKFIRTEIERRRP